MNKGALQNLGVQQMMGATNNNYSPSLWNINNNLIKPPFTSSPSSSSSTITNFLSPPPINNNNIITPNYNINNFNNSMNMSMNSSLSWLDDDNHFQEHPSQFHESLSQLLLSGILMGEEGRKMEKWEEQIGIEYHHSIVDQMKQECSSVNSYNTNNNNMNDINNKNNNIFITHQINNNNNNIAITSSPQSCVSTTLSDNLHPRHNLLPISDHSSECNSTRTSGAQKKPKIQPSSSPSTFKVRKEKLGDRITSLHQLVSPFGKTDTASVLLEAIGYIRFLHGQIEALSLPYLTSGAGDENQPHLDEVEKKCIFPEDPGQFLDAKSLKRKGGTKANQDSNEEAKDLRSKGLCLVPLSCTMHVGSDNGADYWAPAIGGGGFR